MLGFSKKVPLELPWLLWTTDRPYAKTDTDEQLHIPHNFVDTVLASMEAGMGDFFG